jgi:aspartate aminotransferase
MTGRIAHRLSEVKPSATVAIAQRARELRAQGIDVLSFSVGEPDFDPPAHILEAAKKSIDKGASKYTAVRGVVELREAICADSRKFRGGVEHTPDEVMVSVGAKHSLFNLALSLFGPGDEVLVPAPYWVSYPEQIVLAGAKPVVIETGAVDGYRLTPEKLRAALTPKTRALILCSPSNPTGAAYSGEQLAGLVEVLRDHSAYIVTDEIYSRLVYGGFRQQSILEIAPELRDRIVVVDGVSKAYAMTGWRIGWILAPKDVAKACDTIQGQSTTNPTAVAQYAALAALTGPQEPVEEMRKAFEKRRAIIVEGLNALDGVKCAYPEGAFYAWADVTGLIGKRADGVVLEDDLAVARYFLEDARCAVVPGTAFGAPGHLRISYAASDEQLREGLARLAASVSKL